MRITRRSPQKTALKNQLYNPKKKGPPPKGYPLDYIGSQGGDSNPRQDGQQSSFVILSVPLNSVPSPLTE